MLETLMLQMEQILKNQIQTYSGETGKVGKSSVGYQICHLM